MFIIVFLSSHAEDFHRPWYALLKQAGIENFRIYDLRKLFGNKSQSTTLVYGRLAAGPIRELNQRGADKMMEFVKK